MQKLRILFVCAEFVPYAKSGGLADMVAGLARFLAAQGHELHVCLPAYGQTEIDAAGTGDHPVRETDYAGTRLRYTWRRASSASDAVQVNLLDCPQLYGTDEIYTEGDFEALRFIFLCRAALGLCRDLKWVPDIVHCHDWHAALTPALLQSSRRRAGFFAHSRSVLTVHNIGYQGIFPMRIAWKSLDGVLSKTLTRDELTDSQINLLKTGIRHADALTTVSPTHAREIQTPEFGMGLDSLLRDRSSDLLGILNGVDYNLWNPETDSLICKNYSPDTLEGKFDNKLGLRDQLGINFSPDVPLVGLVSRLVTQKGIDLVIEAIPRLLSSGDLHCVFLGDGEPRYVSALNDLAAKFSGRFAFVAGYDDSLAHRIIAGSDLLLVPSRYEPCGLTQMYALRYGTVPVVRHTGGLADSVRHFDSSTGQGTGSVFRDADPQGLFWGLTTALGWFGDKAAWTRLQHNGMKEDFSWQRQGPGYEKLYRRLAGDRHRSGVSG